ncbi:sulfotransferase family protein [Glycomyces buryatensis]|uniref:Sulfotransferase n=1 Tax=Glycomyces buryatensis TaxID=2570927 RepID=A0A4S8Q3A2_9ACTN|nr:sulfotransferase [Glycomyces buryatensis]THV37022.1 sulfotransferase [Glycomyces buryatensis]
MNRVAPWLKAVNTVLTPTIANRRKKIDKIIEKAVHNAETRIGGTHSGDEQFIDDYRFLLRCFADIDGLSPTGWSGMINDVSTRIENRLRIRKLHVQHPEIAAEPIERPIVIVGMPRTGTTLLHRLLGAPEAHRAPLLWELMSTDLGDISQETRDEYRKRSDRITVGMDKVAPDFRNIHSIGTDEPEECVFLLPHGLMFAVRADSPRYVQWMLERDYTDDYRYLKQGLQVLQHGRPRRRWVLKSPAHLWSLDVLLKTFPDAEIVWTHREPATVLASMCSLAETSMSLHMHKPDPHSIGRQWLGLLATGIDRTRAVRRQQPRDTIIDVPYEHLTKEARERIPELFERLDTPWGKAEQDTLETALDRPGGSGGRHKYELSPYGITETEVNQVFSEYRRFIGDLE